MKNTQRGYTLPEDFDTLEDSLKMLNATFSKIESEQNAQDQTLQDLQNRLDELMEDLEYEKLTGG